jgi:hypothetical protein
VAASESRRWMQRFDQLGTHGSGAGRRDSGPAAFSLFAQSAPHPGQLGGRLRFSVVTD